MEVGQSFAISTFAISQENVDKSIVKFFESNMIPLHAVESGTFKQLIRTLNPTKQTISRRTLGRRIVDSYSEMKQFLISLLGEINWVATTADGWTAHKKSYLGMTVHWIDPVTRARMHAVLACRRLKGTQSYDVLT